MKRDYALNTFLIQANDNSGGWLGGRAICSDGVTRAIKRIARYADTWFSVPAAMAVKGKTVTGYITIQTVEGYDTSTEHDPAVVKFIAYQYRRNAAMLPRGAHKGNEDKTL